VTPPPLTFEGFARRIADALRIDPDGVVPGARFVDDLGLDSFDLVEALTVVEELGVRLPDDVAVDLDTMGDLYDEYVARASSSVR
jgi:acyl carrier protein